MDPDEIDATVNDVLGGLTTGATSYTTPVGAVYGPFQEEGSGVPAWLAAEYQRAQQDYADAVLASQRIPKYDTAAAQSAKMRLDAARQNLNSIRSSLDNFRAKATASKPAPTPFSRWTPYYARYEDDPTTGQRIGVGQPLGMVDPNDPTNKLAYPASAGKSQAEINADIAEAQARAELYRRQAGNVGVQAPKYPSVTTHGNKAYSVDPYTGGVKEVYDFGPSEPSPWERQTWEAEQAWKEKTAEEARRENLLNREADMARQRMSTAGSLAGSMAQASQAAVPYAMLPAQRYWLGAEPGGLADVMGRRIGLQHNAELFRPQPIQFDPLQAWRQAAGALGVK